MSTYRTSSALLLLHSGHLKEPYDEPAKAASHLRDTPALHLGSRIESPSDRYPLPLCNCEGTEVLKTLVNCLVSVSLLLLIKKKTKTQGDKPIELRSRARFSLSIEGLFALSHPHPIMDLPRSQLPA